MTRHITNFKKVNFIMRNRRVMFDKDVAKLYGTTTEAIKNTVKSNSSRFPEDFMFRLTKAELQELDCHNKTTIKRKPPLVFTALGITMLSTVLNNKRAIEMNKFIMRNSRIW